MGRKYQQQKNRFTCCLHQYFRASKKSSACLSSERNWKNLSHVPALRHVKEPSTSLNYERSSKIPCIVPSFASRGLSCLCGAWRLSRWMRGTHWGARVQSAYKTAVPKKPHTRPLTLTYTYITVYIIQCVLSAVCSAFLGPSCTQTCFDNATCVGRLCVCDEFFVMSGDWTKCLPRE